MALSYNSCLDSLIGLDGVCTAGTYTHAVNNLPGVTFTKIAKTAGSDDITGTNLFNKLKALTLAQLENDILGKIGYELDFNRVLSSSLVGIFDVDDDLYTGTATAKGFEIEKNSIDQLSTIKINSVSCYITAIVATTATITITDGSITTVKAFTAQIGLNTFELDYTCQTNKVQVTIDPSNLTFREARWGGNYDSCRQTCDCYSVKGFNVRGYENTGLVGDLGIFTISASVVCDPSKVICMLNKSTLGMAAMYKFGINLMKEILGSERANPLVRMSQVQAAYFLTEWEGGIDEVTGKEKKSEYWRYIGLTVKQAKQMIQKLDSACLSCSDGGMRMVSALP